MHSAKGASAPKNLEETAELYEAALRAGGLATWETDFVAGTRTWTCIAADLFGFDVEAGVAIPFDEVDHLLDIMHPDDKQLLDKYRALLNTQD